MSKSIVVFALVAVSSFAIVGCSAETTDQQASMTDQSELNATQFTRLDSVNAAQVADETARIFGENLDQCLAGHPDIRVVTKANAGTLTSVGNVSYPDVHEAIEAMLDAKAQASAEPSQLKSWIRDWALDQVTPFVKDGLVKFDALDPFIVYRAASAAEERASLERAESPRGADLKALRAEWRSIQMVKDNLDSAFLRPVKVSGEPTLTQMKKHFGIPYEAQLVSWGDAAVDDMAAAQEGPAGDPAFDTIKKTLKSAPGIRKRFYFAGSGDYRGGSFRTNVLVVLDEKNQLWGFSMGYSE